MGIKLVPRLTCPVLLMSQLPEKRKPVQPNDSNTAREQPHILLSSDFCTSCDVYALGIWLLEAWEVPFGSLWWSPAVLGRRFGCQEPSWSPQESQWDCWSNSLVYDIWIYLKICLMFEKGWKVDSVCLWFPVMCLEKCLLWEAKIGVMKRPFQLQAFVMMIHSWKGSHKFSGSISPSSLDPPTPGLKSLSMNDASQLNMLPWSVTTHFLGETNYYFRYMEFLSLGGNPHGHTGYSDLLYHTGHSSTPQSSLQADNTYLTLCVSLWKTNTFRLTLKPVENLPVSHPLSCFSAKIAFLCIFNSGCHSFYPLALFLFMDFVLFCFVFCYSNLFSAMSSICSPLLTRLKCA